MKKPDPADFDLPKSESALAKELRRTKIELEIYKNRKAIRFVDFFLKIIKTVFPAPVRKFLRGTILRSPSTETRAFRRYSGGAPVSGTIRSKYPYPNLRIAVIGRSDPLDKFVYMVRVARGWEKTLRPGMDCMDGLLINMSSDNLDAELVQSGVLAAKKFKIPVIFICDNKSGLDNPIIKSADVVVYTGKDPLKNAAGIIRPALPYIDIYKFNPTLWQREPTGGLQIIGERGPSAEDLKLSAALAHAGLGKAEAFVNFKLKSFHDLKTGKPFPFTEGAFEESKYYFATVCLPSMFSSAAKFEKAVLQLLAGGACVLTTDQKLVSKLSVPALLLCSDTESVNKLKDLDYREATSIRSRREIIDKYSYARLVDRIIKEAKIKAYKEKVVSLLLCTNRPDYIDHSIKNVSSQTYKDIELILALHGDNFNRQSIAKKLDDSGIKYKIVQSAASELFGDCLNKALDQAGGYYAAKIDDDDYYGPNHIADLVQAINYSQADVVGKWGHFVYLEKTKQLLSYRPDQQEKYGGHLPGGTFLTRTSLLEEFRFGRVKYAIDSELWQRIKKSGGQLYSTHGYNYIRVRHGGNTWDADDKFFIERSAGKAKSEPPENKFV